VYTVWILVVEVVLVADSSCRRRVLDSSGLGVGFLTYGSMLLSFPGSILPDFWEGWRYDFGSGRPSACFELFCSVFRNSLRRSLHCRIQNPIQKRR
jgi:hypothetical protein